jgi:predicted  nucleic acid-binding Zn-ribbon protein
MAPVLKIAETKPVRSPERQALAAAIEKAQALLGEINATSAAIQYAKDEVRSAKSQVAKYETELASAKSDQAKILVARALGDDKRTVQKPAEARRALEQARDDLESVEEAQVELTEKLKRMQHDFTVYAERKVQECAQAVIKSDPATQAHLRRLGDLERDFKKAQVFLTQQPLFHPRNKHDLIGDTRIDITAAEQPFEDWNRALQSDADASFAP